MKKLTLITTLFIVWASLTAQTKFHKIFQSIGFEKFSGIEKTSDGYIAVGATNSFGASQKDVLVIKTDINGDTIWTRTFGGFYNEEAFNVINTTDGNYVVVGYTTSYSNYSNDSANFFVLKIAPNGNLIWSRSFGGPSMDIAKNVIETSNHNYLVIESTNSLGAGCKDVYLLNLSSSGNYLWSRSLGSSGCEYATNAIELGDKGFIISGKTSSFSFGGYVPFVLRTDSIGSFLWVKTYDIPGSYSPKNITSNDIIRGYTNDLLFVGSKGLGISVGDAQHYIIDIDSLGNLNWAKSYLMNSGNSEAASIDKTNSGGFIVGGWMGNYAPALLKVDAIGQRLWSWVYDSPIPPYYSGKGFKTLTTSDGGYITTGMRYTTGDTIAFLFKTDVNGIYSCTYNAPTSNASGIITVNISSQTFTTNLTNLSLINTCETHYAPYNYLTYCSIVGLQEAYTEDIFDVFPNPFYDILNINTNNNKLSEITLYDITTRKIIQQKFTNHISLNTDLLKNGIYIYEIKNESNVIIRRKAIKD